MKRLCAFAAITCATLGMLAAAAGANPPSGVSPEYDMSWIAAGDTVSYVAAQVPAPTTHERHVDVAPVVISAPSVPEYLPEDIQISPYTGPSVESKVPGGTVVTDHPVAMPSDPRVLTCNGSDPNYDRLRGTFPAASIADHGLVDYLIAAGVCVTVN